MLHDAFIHFTALARPNLAAIRNLDGYLYKMLRNLHISQERRSSRARFQQLSIVEYESAATGLRTIDSRDVIRVQDELRRVCHYACLRKERAKLASVLILRFFHGYYPSEIAQILRSPRAAIDKWLQLARAEAKLMLSDLDVLELKDTIPTVDFIPATYARSVEDLLKELRQRIFQARSGNCFSNRDLNEFYRSKETFPMNCERLAHVVSCEQCLDQINQILKLPLLSERYPTDSIGKDTSRKGGGGAGGDGVGGFRGRDTTKKGIHKYRSRAREAFEHHPSELCVSVNGYIQGSHKITSDVSEFDLSANLAEVVNFVEVFSEQGIRLLLLNADEPPPEGADEQTSCASLSDGRSIELTLKYRSSWPTLHLVYRDPTFKAVEAMDVAALEQNIFPGEVSLLGEPPAVLRPHSFLARFTRAKLGLRALLRPATATAVLALVFIAAFLVVRLHRTSTPPVSAENLLQQSANAEEAIAARSDQVVHRTINFEERRVEQAGVVSDDNGLIASRKIEIWRSAEKGITARRLYDDQGQLIAGDWRRADGVQTIYHHKTRPQLQLAPEKRIRQSAIGFEDVWQLDLSAAEFLRMMPQAERVSVEERPQAYAITYETFPAASAVGYSIASARIVLNRVDLHPMEQTLVIRQGNEAREYRFIETGFERKASSNVPPKIFEPEPELIGTNSKTRTRGDAEKSTGLPRPSASSPVEATADDEVEVLRLLDQAGVFLRDQVSVNRSPSGQLIVSGIVENDERKQQITSALVPVTTSRVARVEVETVAEVLQRQQARAASVPVTVERVQVTETNIPLDAELRAYLSSAKRLTAEQLDIEVRQFSERILARSNQALLHALALKPVIERFSSEQLQALPPQARLKWRAILIDHVQSFAAETTALRRELALLFPSLAATAGSPGDFNVENDIDLVRAVRRLMELAGTNDKAVRGSFAISATVNKSVPVKSIQFWHSLASSERLAARIIAQ